MVKGRRVRAVVACARTDDCCSPHPKRRGQKLLEAAPANAITAFFQTVGVDIDGAARDESPPRIIIDLSYQVPEGRDEVTTLMDVPQTPTKNGNRARTPFRDRTPPTPHRIELCADEAIKAAEKVPPPKPKKRVVNVLPDQDSKRNHNNLNHKLTEYFPVRRSVRKTKKTVLEEKKRSLEQLLRSEIEEGLKVKIFEEKGRGVVACRPFNKGDFVVEYSGDLIDINEAKQREIKYAQDKNAGCYMYYFKHNDQQYCVDATAESGRLGRLVNHSRNGNLITRTVPVDNRPRLVLIARDDIKDGEEVTYDYGDRSKESLRHHPWLAY